MIIIIKLFLALIWG